MDCSSIVLFMDGGMLVIFLVVRLNLLLLHILFRR